MPSILKTDDRESPAHVFEAPEKRAAANHSETLKERRIKKYVTTWDGRGGGRAETEETIFLQNLVARATANRHTR